MFPVITAANKLKNIEQTRQAHLARLNNSNNKLAEQPSVVWMGYSVHGNESSGSNAALLVAYYLAAAQGDEITCVSKVMMAKVDQFLDGLINYEKENIHPNVLVALEPYLKDKEFEPEYIKSKSAAAAGLCSWVINIIKFYRFLKYFF